MEIQISETEFSDISDKNKLSFKTILEETLKKISKKKDRISDEVIQ